MKKYLLSLLVAVIVSTVISIYWSPDPVPEALTGSLTIQDTTTLPTNVVSELSTLCSATEHFGLVAEHNIQYDNDIVQVTRVIFESDNGNNSCHVRKEAPNYKLEGYFDRDSYDGYFSIVTGNLGSIWTKFDESLYDTYLGTFVRDTVSIDKRLDNVDAILSYASNYWLGNESTGNFGTFYTVESEQIPSLDNLLSLTGSNISRSTITVFIPNEDNDTYTYKVRYTVYYEDNSLGVTAEYIEYDVLLQAYFSWDIEFNESNSTDDTEVFEYIYNYIMR